MVGQRVTSDEEDRAEVEVLFAHLEKTKQLSKKIQASSNQLETSGRNVQAAIGPIYGDTQRLQTIGTSEGSTFIPDIELPLRDSPHNTGLSEYLASLDRINEALSRLKTTNFRSNQQVISQLDGFVQSGHQQLEEFFRTLLMDDSRPVEPLNYITKQKQFPVLSQDKVSRLGLINSFVAGSASQSPQPNSSIASTGQMYSDIRGPYLFSTLQNLATASVNTARKKQPDAIYVRGRNNIGDYANGMEAIFLAEYDNVCSLFSRDEWGRIFSLTCQSALEDFSKTLRELNSLIKSNPITDCFLAYEIIEVVSKLATSLDSKTGELKGPISEALRPIRDTAKTSLPTLIEDTRRRVTNLQVLPPDCASVPATTEIMTRLQNLPNYIQPLSSILISLGDGNWSSTAHPPGSKSTTASLKSFDVGADGRQLLAHYITDTIDQLLLSLESKARPFYRQNRSQVGVFLANNTALVDRMIRNSSLANLLPQSLPLLETWRKKGVSNYLDAWREPSSHLLDVQYTNRSHRPHSGSNVNSAEIIKSLSGKDKDAIKEKFRGFNASFEELVARYKSLAMEREVRALLAREIQGMIEPLYGRFWDRYHDIDKGKGKYVKYDKSQLTQTLAALG
ncbi:MAG: exocyst complex component exo70 [Sclerophora amabilis]|nr:MAG: exocyst complex component exo70 [Sclerophora amabilis]